MKRGRPLFFGSAGNSAGLTLAAIACGLLTFSSCGPSPETGAEEAAGEHVPSPYPGFTGGDVHGEKNFATLINSYPEGKISPQPWAGYWWPYTANGIASGSYSGGSSPAGKYDAARGHHTQAQTWEAQYHGAHVKGVQGWWGHCNGWSAAAQLFPEPQEDAVVNGIHFSRSDIKALLSEVGMAATADFFGNRVDPWTPSTSPAWNDVIPNQMFLVLTNYIGKLHQGVNIDRYTGDQVWNQPLAGYKIEYPQPSDYLGASPTAPNVYRILLTTTIWWMEDNVVGSESTTDFTFQNEGENATITPRTLKAEIWLDGPVEFGPDGKITKSGNVVVTRDPNKPDFFVGGAWRMGEGFYNDSWPDYMWIPYTIARPTDPDEDYVNPYIDADWLKAHLLVPGGADDTSVTAGSVDPAPSPAPRPSNLPPNQPNEPPPTHIPLPPMPGPTYAPTTAPTYVPAPGPTHAPGTGPTHAPTPGPTRHLNESLSTNPIS